MSRIIHLIVIVAFFGALPAGGAAEPKELKTLKGYAAADPTHTIAFSPEGKTLATSSSRNILKLWDVKTGKELETLKQVARLGAFSPDGKTLVLIEREEVILLDVETRKERFRLKMNGQVAFRPKTNTLAIGGLRGDCKLWDVETGKERATIKNDRDLILYSMAFSLDGTLLAIGSQNGCVSIWDVETQKSLARGQSEHGFGNHSVKTLSFTPDAKKLVFFSGTGGYGPGDVRDQSISSWEFAKEKKPANVESIGTTGVSQILFSPDGRWRATTGFDGNCRLVGPDSKSSTTFKEVRFLAFSADSKAAATVHKDNTITLWELDPSK